MFKRTGEAAQLTSSPCFADVYGGYMTHAFPHDELRPISRSHTDSLVELGADSPTRSGYHGVALTLIDSLDTLAVLGNASEFAWAVRWVSENVSFDLDVEVRATALDLFLNCPLESMAHASHVLLPRARAGVAL